MSCDGNRTKFFQHVVAWAGAGTGVAVADLESLYQANRGLPADPIVAEAKTRTLFMYMVAAGFTPPTHAKSGLPKRESQPGYAAVYDFMKARGLLDTTRVPRTTTGNPTKPRAKPPVASPAYIKRLVRSAPQLQLIANGMAGYWRMDGGQAVLIKAAQAIMSNPSLDANMVAAATAFIQDTENHVAGGALANELCALAGVKRCQTCQGFSGLYFIHYCITPSRFPPTIPTAMVTEAQAIIRELPEVIELAAGDFVFSSMFEPASSKEVEIIQRFVALSMRWVEPSTPAAQWLAATHFVSHPSNQPWAVMLATTICETAGFERCASCQRFCSSSTAHVCPPVTPSGDISPSASLMPLEASPTSSEAGTESASSTPRPSATPDPRT